MHHRFVQVCAVLHTAAAAAAEWKEEAIWDDCYVTRVTYIPGSSCSCSGTGYSPQEECLAHRLSGSTVWTRGHPDWPFAEKLTYGGERERQHNSTYIFFSLFWMYNPPFLMHTIIRFINLLAVCYWNWKMQKNGNAYFVYIHIIKLIKSIIIYK